MYSSNVSAGTYSIAVGIAHRESFPVNGTIRNRKHIASVSDAEAWAESVRRPEEPVVMVSIECPPVAFHEALLKTLAVVRDRGFLDGVTRLDLSHHASGRILQFFLKARGKKISHLCLAGAFFPTDSMGKIIANFGGLTSIGLHMFPVVADHETQDEVKTNALMCTGNYLRTIVSGAAGKKLSTIRVHFCSNTTRDDVEYIVSKCPSLTRLDLLVTSNECLGVNVADPWGRPTHASAPPRPLILVPKRAYGIPFMNSVVVIELTNDTVAFNYQFQAVDNKWDDMYGDVHGQDGHGDLRDGMTQKDAFLLAFTH